MQIELVASWKGKTDEESDLQLDRLHDVTAGGVGYLYEDRCDLLMGAEALCPEALARGAARIDAKLLRERLPEALFHAEKVARIIGDEKEIEEVKRSFTDFVAFCEEKQKETGEPVLIEADQLTE